MGFPFGAIACVATEKSVAVSESTMKSLLCRRRMSRSAANAPGKSLGIVGRFGRKKMRASAGRAFAVILQA